MSDTELRQRLAARFREVNGDHPMSTADDAYVSEQFAELEAVCVGRGGGDAARRLMLEGLLPLPGYLRSDGAEMVPRDLFSLADEAGGVEGLEAWFTGHWADPAEGKAEWAAYLSGQYVCLHTVSPATIRRKDRLTAAIAAAADAPGDPRGPWAERLHALVDELDRLEPAFCAYDRLRFGGPTSRDLFVDAMRARFPRPGAAA
ncbi:DUF6058 family natural product biosynthesis protein [Streptomyces sp. KE1]|uniref:DUF6058 family natural product biosynthesis protein n=1 Tax=Streptomyces sp. KE1 TaxID=1638939 RepID=UPI00063E8E0E|nr:DUF6058 family natural product biosynthesis protein [Streptomyces sp. KE1]KLI99986.1 hypothetical protein WQ59_16370 [Streptomyces sp. KE1]